VSRGSRARRAAASEGGRAEHIGTILDDALRGMGVRHEVREVQLRDAFIAVVGPALAPLCRAISIEKGVLLVATKNSALAHQLQMEMPTIVAGLNREMGGEHVKRLRFTALG